jgi:uncharacterized membrane protein
MTPKRFNLMWCTCALLSTLVAIVSYRYLAQKGPVPPNVADNQFFHPWIVVHAASAATALLLGSAQFLPVVRRRWPSVHRWIGRTYLVSCLVGGGSALALSAGVSAGPVAGLGFATLGILWIYVTTKGWYYARSRRWAQHRRWMIRSFALTFAAVTLRVYLPIGIVLSSSLGFEFLSAYRVIAWLAWVPNALLAELYLRKNGALPDQR